MSVCQNCSRDIGNSLWGFCSLECLTKLVGEVTIFSADEMIMLRNFIAQSGWHTGMQKLDSVSNKEYEEFLKKLGFDE